MDICKHIINQLNNENIAVIEKERSWTYQEFAEYTLPVCNYLTENKVNKIMVCLPQGFYAYTIIWGAYLAGITFCPVTTSIPLERKKYYASLFKPDIIVGCQSELFEEEIFMSVEHFFSQIDSSTGTYFPKYDPESLAYVIFTSGSTGRPKGVMVTRKGLENFLAWSTKEYNVQAGDRWGQFSNLGFDLSLCDIFTAISNGATLVPFSSTTDKLLPGKAIKSNKITFWHSVPSVIDILNKAEHLNNDVLSTVRVMTFCGERLFPAQLDLLFDANPALTVYNTYGPTEGTIFCTCLKLTKENYREYCRNTVSIGENIPGYEITLTDDKESPDEIVIISDYIAKGYLNSGNESTPLQNDTFQLVHKNGKIYNAYYTGDYGEIIDGNLYFVGRKNSQIKVMGYRIDLSEIDYYLREYGCNANITVFHQRNCQKIIISK
jgi:D-alanine--poly(phosphoribitol) ligase subunit 1